MIADEHLHDDVDDADLSGDDRSIASDVQIGNVTLDHDSMDSDRGGALNLVCLHWNKIFKNKIPCV